MGLQISGKNMDIGEALRAHVEARVSDALEKYFDGGFTGHVTVEPEGSGYASDCTIHLDTGILLQAHGRSQDVYQSFDIAADRIEKRLRRYKRRLKDHHVSRREIAEPAASYVLAAPDEDEEVAVDYSPTVIAEETTNLVTMTVGDAVIALTSNIAIAQRGQIDFDPAWFEIDSDATPDGSTINTAADRYKV